MGSNRTQHPRAQISLSAVYQKAADCADDPVGCGELHHRPLAEPGDKGRGKSVGSRRRLKGSRDPTCGWRQMKMRDIVA